jgi:cyclohexadienyl dehydratase
VAAGALAGLMANGREHAMRMTRRGLAWLFLIAAACGPVRPATPPAPPPDPVLRVGTSGDYPPFSLRAADGSYSGFDVEVARGYAAARGRTLELVPFRWPELAARLGAGEFDVAMGGVTVRADRLVIGTMTAAVARADAVLLVRHGDRRRDIDRSERRVAVNRGGHLEHVARARLRHATIVPVDDNRTLPALLAGRDVDAVVVDTLEAGTFDPNAFVIAARLTHDRKAYWVAPGKAALADDLDAWLHEQERAGTLDRLRAVALHDAGAPALPPELARVVDLIGRRLLLMPMVAAAKRLAGLPIVDPTREAAVLERAGERATTAGLDRDGARALARSEIAAARAVQHATAGSGDVHPPSLAALRSAIDAIDVATIRALAGARAATADVAGVPRPALVAALRADAEVPGFGTPEADAIAAALVPLLQHPQR